MKVVKVDYFTSHVKVSFDDAVEAVRHSVDDVHSDGELERMRERCDNLAGMLGRLLDEVHGLRNEQIENVLGPGYRVLER